MWLTTMRAGNLSLAGTQRLNSSHFLRQQNALLRMFPSCSFAKYARDKPHLNVGTIGKSSSLFSSPLSKLQSVAQNTPLLACGDIFNYNL